MHIQHLSIRDTFGQLMGLFFLDIELAFNG